MMSLTQKEIEHIASLARIRLNQEEKEKMAREMGTILDYIGKLEKVDINGVEPTAQITGQENIFREDKPDKSDENRDLLIDQFPARKNDYLKVKKILDGKK